MSSIPFLISSAGFYLQAYKTTRFEMPLYLPRCYKDSEAYNRAIEALPGHNLKTELQPFLHKMGIRKDLIVCENLNLGFCAAQGTNFFTKGDAVIWVAPRLQQVDKDACLWLMKHEISHIKNNDTFIMNLVPAICSTAAAIFSPFLMPVIPAVLITFSVGIIAQGLFSQYRERKADDLAIAESSIEELKGGRRFLIGLQEANSEARNTTWKKITASPTGENRLDFQHPSIRSRIKKIEHALQQRKIKINDQVESVKIDNLKNLIVETTSNLEEELKKIGTLGLMIAMHQ